jgi:hypothetical protein
MRFIRRLQSATILRLVGDWVLRGVYGGVFGGEELEV